MKSQKKHDEAARSRKLTNKSFWILQEEKKTKNRENEESKFEHKHETNTTKST